MNYDDTYFVNGKSRRIYYTTDKREADTFAHVFSGIVTEYLPNLWRVQI
jgi:hypothetical protein